MASRSSIGGFTKQLKFFIGKKMCKKNITVTNHIVTKFITNVKFNIMANSPKWITRQRFLKHQGKWVFFAWSLKFHSVRCTRGLIDTIYSCLFDAYRRLKLIVYHFTFSVDEWNEAKIGKYKFSTLFSSGCCVQCIYRCICNDTSIYENRTVRSVT